MHEQRVRVAGTAAEFGAAHFFQYVLVVHCLDAVSEVFSYRIRTSGACLAVFPPGRNSVRTFRPHIDRSVILANLQSDQGTLASPNQVAGPESLRTTPDA